MFNQPSPTHVFFEERYQMSHFVHADTSRQWHEQFPDHKFVYLKWDTHTFPGLYNIVYYTKDNGCLCAKCANRYDILHRTLNPEDDQFHIVGCDVLDDSDPDNDTYCDHCHQQINAVYDDDCET